ncbi:MAG: hypothetical protein ACKOUM_02780 [Sphingopyxis sp.]
MGIITRILKILACPAARLLASPHLHALCTLAARARSICAMVSVGAFLAMVIILLSFAAFPLAWVPIMLGAACLLFITSVLIGYRFGRLCRADIGASAKNAIRHHTTNYPAADAYYRAISTQSRPFTRLDLNHLRRLR